MKGKIKCHHQSFNLFKVSASKTQLDNIERHVRKFRKEYSHIHEWYAKADNEIRKIENKQISTNTKEETDWIRVNSFLFLFHLILSMECFQTTRNDIKKLETNFDTLKNLERTIQKEANRPLTSLNDKILELKRLIDQLDRRLKDRSEIVEVKKISFVYQIRKEEEKEKRK